MLIVNIETDFDNRKLKRFELADVLSSALNSRILHQNVQSARERERGGVLKFIHVVNHDTSVHVEHSRTVAFRQTVRDVHTNTVAFSIQS